MTCLQYDRCMVKESRIIKCDDPSKCFIVRRPSDTDAGGLTCMLTVKVLGVSVSLHFTFSRGVKRWQLAKPSKGP